jgi:hypothetical protein
MSTVAIVILVVVLLAVLFAAGWYFGGVARSRRLRNRFGPEYDRSLESAENRRLAERELTEREKRHSQLNLRQLSVAARARYTDAWTRIQERFVDEPGAAVAEADDLVHDVMRERGYPTENFDQQAADLSVEHADVVGRYRDAHRVRGRGDAGTEDLRGAMIHYRAIFHALVGPVETVEDTRDHDGHHDQDGHHAPERDHDVPAAREHSDHVAEDTTVDGTRMTRR